MARYFKPITIEELKNKIDGNDDLLESANIERDLNKIQFDMENHTCTKNEFSCGNEENSLVGYNILENGLSFLGHLAGGDWEDPLFFIIYWDGKKLRAYIPSDGNTYNHNSKTAFGSEADGMNSEDTNTFMEADFSELSFLDFSEPEELPEWANKYLDDDHKEFDWELIKLDIINRIIKKI
jgi:hypothetical protein